MSNLETKTINTVRVLSAEMIDKANSGHPGLPLGSATIGYTLYANHLKHSPANSKFDNRDRFVLSAGHGSALQYSLLHMFGYDVTKNDIMNFRQTDSRTPGHPEFGHTDGIETTTGPLGQGIANAVGMAIAETHLAAKFNRDGYDVVDHYTYALCGDGCMQEGIANEATSLAGTLALNKLIVFYDKNNITIEGDIDVAFTEDVGARHIAQGWHVEYINDGNSVEELDKAIKSAKAQNKKPSLIIVKTTIGFGCSLEGTHHCHGAPLGSEETAKMKNRFGITAQPFEMEADVKKFMQEKIAKLNNHEKEWNTMFAKYKKAHPDLAKEYAEYMSGKIVDLSKNKEIFEFDKADATRNTSFAVLNKLAKVIPNLMGGSADLAPSNKSNMTSREYYSKDNRLGTNLHFGIREHAMAGVCNGMALHGGLFVYCATFFVFSDYMKHSMRLSAIMNIPVTYILTHDSIGVGEDGATHEPVEQLIALRSIPNMKVFRPADGKETAVAWVSALNGEGPTSIVLTRQNLPQYDKSGLEALKGGYILADSKSKTPDCLLIATGSEVELGIKAQQELAKDKIDARVISMPCIELFEKQTPAYKESIMPNSVRARVGIEAGSKYSLIGYVGLDGATITMDTFGKSGKAEQLFEIFGFSVANVVKVAKEVVAKNK